MGVRSVHLGHWIRDIHLVVGGYDRPLNPLKACFEESLAPGIDLGCDLSYS